ncbi:MAG: mechanosensitive ion channel domain-containing protein, partial [Elusimicrobiota bacterium]
LPLPHALAQNASPVAVNAGAALRGIAVPVSISGGSIAMPSASLSLTLGNSLSGIAAYTAPLLAPGLAPARAGASAYSRSVFLSPSPRAASVGAAPHAAPVQINAPIAAALPSREGIKPQLSAKSTVEDAGNILREPQEGSQKQESSWKNFWTGSSAKPQGEGTPAVDASELSPEKASAARLSPARTTSGAHAAAAIPLAVSAVPGAAQAASQSLPPWAATSLKVATPYLHAGGVLLATWLATKAVSRGLTALWKWKKWDPNAFLVARLGAKTAVWGIGGTIALKMAGMTWGALAAGLGIGGLAVTLSVKKFLGNFISGLTLFMSSPFKIGERIRVGDTDYTVKDMTFRNLVLQDQDGTFTLMDYTTLTSKPIGLYRKLEKRSAALGLLAGSLKDQGNGKLMRALRTLGVTTLLGSLAWGGMKVHTAVAFSRPYLHGGLALAAAWLAARGVGLLLQKLSKKYGWNQNVHALIRLASIGATWLLGGVFALHLAGVTWTALLTGAGVLGTALGIAATDVITNLLEASWMILTQPFRIGDKITIGDSEGVVSDMTLRYVVLETHEDGRLLSTLIPYALFGESPLKVHKEYVPKTRLNG